MRSLDETVWHEDHTHTKYNSLLSPPSFFANVLSCAERTTFGVLGLDRGLTRRQLKRLFRGVAMSNLAVESGKGRFRSPLFSLATSTALAIGAVISLPAASFADEDVVSFWLPGIYGSLAAVPQQPGFTFTAINYFDSVSGSGSIAAAREITIGKLNPTVNVSLNATATSKVDVVLPYLNYVFATPVFGGQLALGMFGIVGNNSTAVDGTLTLASGPFAITRQGSISQTAWGVGDLYPVASMRWNNGVNNWMVYGTGDIPVGDYSPTNLANFGIGHGAVDFGGGYTYFNPQTGHEFSAVAGFTYNLINPTTNYQNGIDWHLDWGASQFVTKQIQVGAVGYFYEQVSPDRGCAPQLCPFESGVIGIGPQLGFIIPAGSLQAYINLKAYGEFDGHDRPSGWNAWLTLSFSPSAPTNPKTAMLTK